MAAELISIMAGEHLLTTALQGAGHLWAKKKHYRRCKLEGGLTLVLQRQLHPLK